MDTRQNFPLLLISILIGAVIGLVYGWVINPIHSANCTPDAFRTDYKADYVLMTAESYAGDQDLDLARDRLNLLFSNSPVDSVQDTLDYAQENQFYQEDLELLEQLLSALNSQSAAPNSTLREEP